MYYSVCCGAESYMGKDIDICPICKEHTDWERYDEEVIELVSSGHIKINVTPIK